MANAFDYTDNHFAFVVFYYHSFCGCCQKLINNSQIFITMMFYMGSRDACVQIIASLASRLEWVLAFFPQISYLIVEYPMIFLESYIFSVYLTVSTCDCIVNHTGPRSIYPMDRH